ncbi:hypothetical protein ACHAP7_005181 [Fusarium lateritium]
MMIKKQIYPEGMPACQEKPPVQASVKKEANLVAVPRSTLRPNAAAVGRFDHETYVEKRTTPEP